MKENDLNPKSAIERKLQEQLLLSRHVKDDRLMLDDAVLGAALDGSRPLTIGERQALASSPLTLRRFRHLALERRKLAGAANDAIWSGSEGMLRAAASSEALAKLATDDGFWTLHFLQQEGAWVVILKLAAAAPFAGRLVREHVLLRVTDGGGAIVLQDRLDADGECECAWPFEFAPAPHFQRFGAGFAVLPVRP
jgi:hypothetical protein